MNESPHQANHTGTAPLTAPPAAGLPEELRRGLGIAILKARADCCPSCSFLATLREHLGDQLQAAPQPVPVPAPAAAANGRRTAAPTH